MSYKISAKNRRLKRNLLNMISILKFESLNIETNKKIVIFGVILGIFSLFLNWTDSIDQKHMGNSFKSILGITGYLLLITNIKTLFIIFSKKIKETIKFFFNFNAKDGTIVIFLGTFGLFLSINSIFIINNFNYFTDGIIVGKGVILSIVGYIFVLIGGILMLKTKTNTSVYIDGIENNKNNDNSKCLNEIEENNMKLPF